MVRKVVRVMTRTSVADRQQGFTLLELMVVVSLIAIFIGLVVPNLGLTEKSSFNAEVRKAATMLNHARRIAIVQARPSVAELRSSRTMEESTVVTDSMLDTGLYNLWSSERISLAYQDELANGTLPKVSIEFVFFPQGGSTGGTVHFAQNQRNARIHVNPVTGRIAIAYQGEAFDDEY
jgi:general secretion pathway protein H